VGITDYGVCYDTDFSISKPNILPTTSHF